MAPIQVGIYPLVKKDGLAEKAMEIYKELSEKFLCVYDSSGSIGRRYSRSDSIGTPFGITIDYDTLKDNTVTVRERDSMEQERVKINELKEIIKEKIETPYKQESK